jgi:hypothetical protein
MKLLQRELAELDNNAFDMWMMQAD